MTKQKLSGMMEILRPAGIGMTLFCAYSFGADAGAQFHIMGPFIVMLMCGTVAFESLVLGEAASEKIGYAPNRAYQIQSGLANAAMALTALLVFLLDWGKHADATIVTAMLLFFLFSAANHLRTALNEGNKARINLLRPLSAILLTGILLPPMIHALLH